MAVDLRKIVGALPISNDLERVGDLAENIGKRVLLLTGEFCIEGVMLQLRRMARLARDQLEQVLQSYERRDVPAALDVWRKDRCGRLYCVMRRAKPISGTRVAAR